jgi:hypothetical protein
MTRLVHVQGSLFVQAKHTQGDVLTMLLQQKMVCINLDWEYGVTQK